MNLHHVLEWMLAGAFLACGAQQISLYHSSNGTRGSPVMGALCLAAAVIAATAHQWGDSLGAAVLTILGVATACYLRVRTERRLDLRVLASAAMLLALFVGGHVLLTVRLDGWWLALQWGAIAIPVIAFLGYWGWIAWELSRPDGDACTLGPVSLLLATAILFSAVASVQHHWSPYCFYAAGLCAYLGAMLLVDNKNEDLLPAHGGRTGEGSEHSHRSRLAVVGELTASIAHEINQPLSAILSNVDAADILLEDSEPPLDELRKIIGDVRRDGLRASDVIRNVRMLTQKRDPDLIKLDLNAVIEGVAELLDQEMRRRDMEIAVSPFPQPVYIRGDRALLMQVLINLVINAMDALEASRNRADGPAQPPPIEVKLSVSLYDEIHLTVVDQGSGIPKEQLEQLFDSFYTSKSHGMGLGLSISRSIVSAHGGRIFATNNDGPGATFHIFLPPYLEE